MILHNMFQPINNPTKTKSSTPNTPNKVGQQLYYKKYDQLKQLIIF
jgi:hypothetical protein